LIVIDPFYTERTKISSLVASPAWYGFAISTSWQNIIIKEGLYDRRFCRELDQMPHFYGETDTKKLLRKSDIVSGAIRISYGLDTITNAPQVWNTETVSYELPKIKVALDGKYNIELADGKKLNVKQYGNDKDNVKEWTPEKAAD